MTTEPNEFPDAIVTALENLKAAFEAAGLRQPVALELDSPDQGYMLGSALERGYSPLLDDDDKLAGSRTVAGITIRWPGA